MVCKGDKAVLSSMYSVGIVIKPVMSTWKADSV